MMYNFSRYTASKEDLLEKMDSTKARIMELEGFGIDVSESIQKIDRAMESVRNDKISIVLIGAFSDGKTSVVAGWLNEKWDNMKISTDESSDEISFYTPKTIPEGCQIVDTPGLFGNKVGADENGERIALSKKTQKYISEANLILYVVAAKNPIKDSHKECVRWILKDLNKQASTIFVINRMDDVADMTDDDDYATHSKIKSENLREKLLDCGLSASEAQTVRIVCISAAPDGKGMEFWKDNRTEYLRRSRLSTLEKATNDILQNSRQQLIVKTGCDILNDEIKKALEMIHEEEKCIEDIILPEQKETVARNKKDLEGLRKRLLRSRGEIKDRLNALERRKIAAVRAATMENFRDTMEDEMGILRDQFGYRLEDDINDIFREFSDKHSEWTLQLGKSIEDEYAKQNEMMESLLSKGAGALSCGLKGTKFIGLQTIKNSIFAGRNLLGKMGMVIKFKPWQVTKMASFCTKALPLIGCAIDIISGVISGSVEQKRNKKFEKNKDIIKEGISQLFRDIIVDLNDDEQYFSDFAPQYCVLRTQIENDEIAITQQEKLLKDFKKWEKTVSDADFDFA